MSGAALLGGGGPVGAVSPQVVIPNPPSVPVSVRFGIPNRTNNWVPNVFPGFLQEGADVLDLAAFPLNDLPSGLPGPSDPQIYRVSNSEMCCVYVALGSETLGHPMGLASLNFYWYVNGEQVWGYGYQLDPSWWWAWSYSFIGHFSRPQNDKTEIVAAGDVVCEVVLIAPGGAPMGNLQVRWQITDTKPPAPVLGVSPLQLVGWS